MDEGPKDRVYLAALAGLLHDVGKFAQRANEKDRYRPHSEVGSEVVVRVVPEQWRGHLYPVMGHHDKPLQGYETKVVALADRLSAGERADETQEQPRQLLSIFCRIEADDKQAPMSLYWPLKALALREDVLFPKEQPDGSYGELWKHFEEDAQALHDAHTNGGDLSVYLESLLLLLQRYTWCVPSAYYRSLPDVSLYDHSRMTAALAAILSAVDEPALDGLLDALDEWYRARKQAEQQKRDPKTIPPPPILCQTQTAILVGGDISGVQDFIYTITDRGATSALRGRSFYLQLLTEAVARYVLRRLELPITNLIYQGGGAFYLLARADDGNKLRELQREVDHILLAHHRGDLYLALTGVPLAAADFYDGRISGKWEELAQALRGVKQRRFSELDSALLERVLEPQDHGGNEEKQCQVCGQEHPQTRGIPGRDGGEETRKCPPCISYEALGDDLRRAAYLWLAEVDIPQPPRDPLAQTPGGWKEALAAFGMYAGVVKGLGGIPKDTKRRLVLALEDALLENLRPDTQTAIGRRFLVNVTPIITQAEIDEFRGKVDDLPEAGSVKPFSVLEKESKGIERLGVLRMDVDNLGDIFASGLGERATLSRVAALSFAISLYFEGWVGWIAGEMNADSDAKDTLYSIYSGGDDLFFVGAWDRVVELARRIRADLTPFAANHPGIHTSAGIVLVGGKYPLAQAAQDAGDAEKHAKQRDGKDALNFLGQTTAWARFGLEECTASNLETVHGMAHHLLGLVKEEGGPKALLRRLIRLQAQHDEADRQRRDRGDDINRAGQEQVLYGPWMWRGAYYLKRMAKQYEKKNAAMYDALEALHERLRTDRFRAIEWIGLAARWAELLGRESSQEE
ncbi:MAG: type III-A CRISPR-associated protein Cas10/Csm1 [Anaerolineae bacterium]